MRSIGSQMRPGSGTGCRGGGRWRGRAAACLAALAALSLAPDTARAGTIDVLWYTYSDAISPYRQGIESIAASAGAQPAGRDSWTLTWFEPDDVIADFSAYDVLVIHGGEKWRTREGCMGVLGCYPSPDYRGILDQGAAIAAARGERTVISASDADFHAVRGDSGNPAGSPGYPAGWDGALGYVVNAVDWAAAGLGLGVVTFYHGDHDNPYWWDMPQSFLRDELSGHFVNGVLDNSAAIPVDMTDHPVNDGLTSAGLSNWTWSFHGTFDLHVPGYVATVVDRTGAPARALTLVSAVAEPATAGPVLAAAAAIVLLRGRRRAWSTCGRRVD